MNHHLGASSVVLAMLSFITEAEAQTFQFGLMGDTAYTEVGIKEYPNLIKAINQRELSFVVHIGDFEADGGAWSRKPDGPMPCTSESYDRNFAAFQSIKHPLVLTPGDNDWTDCAKLTSQKFDPVAQLNILRAKFFPEGSSLGQTKMSVESQSKNPAFEKFKENLRWSINGVQFFTVHTVGSNDNKTGEPEMDAEQAERQAANIEWLKENFDKAKREAAKGIVIMTQANPGFENYWPTDAKGRYFGPFIGRTSPPAIPTSAHKAYVETLVELMETYEKPVAYLHGDTHLHRIDKPLYSSKTNAVFTNFTRVETFGAPESHWVRAIVDPDDPQVFTFRGEIVPENRHR